MHTLPIKTDITCDTCIDYILARLTTLVTMRDVLSLLNKRKGMFVDGGYTSAPKFHILVVSQVHIQESSKNTFRMHRITTFFTIVKLMF